MKTGFDYPEGFLPVEKALNESRIPGLFTDSEWELFKYDRYKKWLSGADVPKASAVEIEQGRTFPLADLRKKIPQLREGYVTERRSGRYVERRVRTYQSSGGFVRRLPYETLFDGTVVKPYITLDQLSVDMETGEEIMPLPEEWKLCKDATSRFSDPKQVRKTCDNFKWLVRANERNVRLFVTLTYKVNMTDTKQLYQDYRKFVQKLRRAYPAITGYLVAFEPQKRGAWHAHMLLLSDRPFLYIPNRKIHGLWGHGFTKTQSCRNVRDIGTYLTAYLTNVRYGKVTKKGARLGMYPKGFHFLRSSKDGVSRTQVTRWYGEFDTINLRSDAELIYDYENVRALDRDRTMYNVTKIFCFKETDPPPN